jgi:ureidoglycolate lyase
MVALGEPGTALDFVVVQFSNGVGVEDCQEVLLESTGDGETVWVALKPVVDGTEGERGTEMAKL